MSFESWKAEFYPITAEKAATSPESALAHSVQKWAGKLSHNRAKHGVVQSSMCVFAHGEQDSLMYDASTCALCHQYVMLENTCNNCPIVQNTGIPCIEDGDDDDDDELQSAYNTAIDKRTDYSFLMLIAAMTGETYDEVARRFLPPDGKSSILDSRIDV